MEVDKTTNEETLILPKCRTLYIRSKITHTKATKPLFSSKLITIRWEGNDQGAIIYFHATWEKNRTPHGKRTKK